MNSCPGYTSRITSDIFPYQRLFNKTLMVFNQLNLFASCKKNVNRHLFLIFCLIATSGWSQIALEADPFAASFFAQNITQEELKEQLTRIASEEFEGRETGSPGLEKAAQYLMSRLNDIGVERHPNLKGYYQDVGFSYVQWEKLSIELNGQKYEHLKDFLCFKEQNANLPKLNIKDVIYCGYGIDDPVYSDYRRANLRGKIIMIYPGEPLKKDSTSYITGSRELSDWAHNLDRKLAVAADKKVRVVLVVDPNLRTNISTNRPQVMAQTLHFAPVAAPSVPNTIYISPDMAKAIIGEKEKTFVKNRIKLMQTGMSRPLHLPVDMSLSQHLTRNAMYSKNLLGVIPGIDPALKNEFVVLSAHYDHLGKRGKFIYPGADDNASGTAAVLEIMETIVEAKKQGQGPKRSVMCIFFTAEEKGLLGSKYYALHPVVPFSNTVVNVNIDMIGRTDSPHEKDPHYIYVIGSDRLSTDLHQINEATNEAFTFLNLDYTYNAKNDPNRFYYRSDHYNFAKEGVPSIFFFSGVHSDYHQPGDTVGKILFEKYQAVTKHIFHTVWELANRQERIRVDVVDDTIYNR
ncbi:MAG: M28 family peptidase [Saprospiraceae bacterium]|nr:M28 family peptidase [Saprospiraceae bacterium]